jgi:hypothetical protein
MDLCYDIIGLNILALRVREWKPENVVRKVDVPLKLLLPLCVKLVTMLEMRALHEADYKVSENCQAGWGCRT